ncbi:ribosome maturation factor RimP [Tenuibacillus multivorans]|uniref:Ribosome maturation factor RimP n=1 Tax=Tenuibacillus multivorans TaxID=237069 RepID=A0A1G9XVW9_9BACI|nr:ribosome maturation factor RimP [Tenuibacillus multivorans]GEL75839.1 ribosome maturation factor RimP [Tenuibacillus multivorans]SDN00944.1 ribosome maturation factor RimP [Tenuibacillus multivorans]
MSKKIVALTEELVQPIVDELNLELVEVEFVKEGKNHFLRVYVDKEGGIDIEECGKVSERLSEKLDEADPIEQAYFLEVSSPGVERRLKTRSDFERFIGSHIYVKTYEPIHGDKEFYGDLFAFEEDEITLTVKEKTREKDIKIPFDKIAKANIAVTF